MFKSSIFVTIISFLISLVSFLNQILIAKFFGAGPALDVYLTIASIPTLFSGLIASALSYLLTPTLIKAKTETEDGSAFAGQLFIKLSLITFIICTAGAIVSGNILPYIYDAVKTTAPHIIWTISVATWLTAFVAVMTGFLTSLFNANKIFVFPVCLNFLPYLFTILVTVFFYAVLGTSSIAIGLLIGSFISFLTAFIYNKKRLAFVGGSKEIIKSVNGFFLKIPYAAAAMLCFSVYQSVDAYWGPKLGNANLSYLGYCQRILIALGALVITGPSTVLVPRLTLAFSENRQDDFFNDVNRIVKLIIALSAFVAITGSVMAEQLVQLMFQRGAFTHNDTLAVASILPYMLTGMVIMLSVVMLFRILFITDMGKFVSMLGVLSAVVYFTLSGVGIKVFMLKGIGIAYIITWLTLFCFCMYKIFKGNISALFNWTNLVFLLKLVAILFLVGLSVQLAQGYTAGLFANLGSIKVFIMFLCCGTIGFLIFALLSTTILKLDEVIFLYRGLVLKRGNKANV